VDIDTDICQHSDRFCMRLGRLYWPLTLGLGAVAVVAAASRHAARSATRLREDLLAAAVTTAGEAVASEDLAELPDPVRRYFETALPDDARPIRTARLEQRGELRLGEEWRPFAATEHVTADPPGFVWEGRVEVAPFVDARVVDAYQDGRGSLRATVFGVPVAGADSTPEVDEAELLRYLSEAVWVPTALLPRAGVTWEGLDGERARATLRDGDTTATLTFKFDGDGRVERVHGRRYRQETDDHALWVGYFDDYERRDGFLVPTTGLVEWQLPDVDRPYWRGTVTEFDYDHGRP
jgi:hypothetical protein